MSDNLPSGRRGPNQPPPIPPRGPDNRDDLPPRRALLAWVLVFGMVISMVLMLSGGPRGYREIEDQNEFRKLVEAGQVERCEIVRENGGKTYIRGKLKAGAARDTKTANLPARFWVNVLPSENLEEFLRQNQVPFKYTYPSAVLGQMLAEIVPVVVILGVLYFIFMRQVRSAGMGAMNFGKSRARAPSRDRQKVTFENVAGIEEAKEEVQEIIEFLKAPQKFQRLGGRIPKGVLLMGPPGTGKTLLAKAIAGEADVPFFSISGSDFVEMFVGVGASRVRDMFEQGKKHAPCILFIDEIDAVGRSRFTGIGGGHDEREQTLNALLVEMDGFETSEGVIIVAATNRPDVLDPALLRPGRFDRQIVIDLPTLEGRERILALHARKLKLAPEVDLRRIARGTPGFSGADLANLLNEAALLAARQGKEGIEERDLEEARDKVWWGRERRSKMLDKDEKRITAFHEAGHAVVTCLVPGGEPLHKVTIIPRGMALGATMFLPEKDRLHYRRRQMLAHLATAMGGRVAEELFLDDTSSGARQDLREATDLARRMVCDWGMSDRLGPRTFGQREEFIFLGREVSRSPDYSESTAQAIDVEVDRLVRSAHEQARSILEANAERVRQLAGLLLERETVDGRDAEELIRHGRMPEALRPVPAEAPAAPPAVVPAAAAAAAPPAVPPAPPAVQPV